MNVFAIRHKPTGHFLPARKGTARGFSNDEPVAKGGAHGPRLFTTRHAARCALTAWLTGVFTTCRTGGGYFDDYGETLTVTAAPHRKADEMEIVAYELVELR